MGLTLAAVFVAALPRCVPFDDACRLHLDPALPSPIRAPSVDFFLGTDPIGRSVAARLAYALRTSVLLVAPASIASCALGLALGAIAGAASARGRHHGVPRALGALALFAFDVLLAVPFVLVVAGIAALVDTPTPAILVGVMTLASTPTVAKLARDRVIALHAEGFVDAARALGASPARVLVRHVLPHAAGAVLALAPSLFGQLVLAEAALGYLGLGLPPPIATLGGMIADGQDFIGEAPFLLALPASAIAALVWATGALADALERTEDRDG